ncbi:MAG: nitroreductase family protein [bacterium]
MIELIRNRRSIRKFAETKIESEKIDLLKETVLRAPTSRNLQPCEFIFIENKELLAQLSLAKKHGSSFLKNAPLGVVVCADSKKSDVWVEDASIASILLQFTAQSLGLGSCWIQIRNRFHEENITSREYLGNLLRLQENIKVEAIVAIGYPGEIKEPIPSSQLINSKIITL